MKRTLKFISLLLTSVILFSSCAKKDDDTKESSKKEKTEVEKEEIDEEEETTATDESEDTIDRSLSIKDQILSLDGVVGIKELGYFSYGMEKASNFLITFEQPLDWNDPSKGTFEQRVQYVYLGSDSTEFNIGGYNLNSEDYLAYGPEFGILMGDRESNYIAPEYRFYGESKPEDLDFKKADYWEYLTNYNAACDFHHIATQLKRINSDDWIMTGGSKGGSAVLLQAMYFPEDAEVYMSVVAPYCNGQQDDRYYKKIYESIGNESYGEGYASECRDLILEFQVEAIKNRYALQPQYIQIAEEYGIEFDDYITPEVFYDVAVLEVATYFWQYDQDFDLLKDLLGVKSSMNYFSDMLNILLTASPPYNWDKNSIVYPYFVQSMKEFGFHSFDFSYLRSALEKDGEGEGLAVTEDMEDMLFFKMVLYPEVYDSLTYDGSDRAKLTSWLDTTDTNIVFLYAAKDVWYEMRLPDPPEKKNFLTIIDYDFSHMNLYLVLNAQDKMSVTNFIDDALKDS